MKNLIVLFILITLVAITTSTTPVSAKPNNWELQFPEIEAAITSLVSILDTVSLDYRWQRDEGYQGLSPVVLAEIQRMALDNSQNGFYGSHQDINGAKIMYWLMPSYERYSDLYSPTCNRNITSSKGFGPSGSYPDIWMLVNDGSSKLMSIYIYDTNDDSVVDQVCIEVLTEKFFPVKRQYLLTTNNISLERRPQTTFLEKSGWGRHQPWGIGEEMDLVAIGSDQWVTNDMGVWLTFDSYLKGVQMFQTALDHMLQRADTVLKSNLTQKR